VVLPPRSSTWVGADRREAVDPGSGLVFDFDFDLDHIGVIDSAIPLKRILGAQYSLQLRKAVARKGSSQTLFSDEEITRFTSRSCGEFPGIGRTLPSRHLRRAKSLRLFPSGSG